MRIEDIPQIALFTCVVLIFYAPMLIALKNKHTYRVAILLISCGGGIALWDSIAKWMALIEPLTFVDINIRWLWLMTAGVAICWLILLIWCFVDPKKSATVLAASDSAESDDEKNPESD